MVAQLKAMPVETAPEVAERELRAVNALGMIIAAAPPSVPVTPRGGEP